MNKSLILTSASALLLTAFLCGCGSDADADAADPYGMPTAISRQSENSVSETVSFGTGGAETFPAESESAAPAALTEISQSLQTEDTEIFFTETVTDFFDDTETGEVTEITPAPYVQPEPTSAEITESQTLPAETTTSQTVSSAAATETTTVQTTVQTTAETTASAAAAPASASMTLTYGGASLVIGGNAQNFVNNTSPSFTESAPSCYGNGENINYYYDNFTIFVWNENENYMTYGIDIFGTGVPTSEGIAIGADVDELTAVYGGDYEVQGSDYVYTYGDKSMRFTISGGKVSYISLNKDI